MATSVNTKYIGMASRYAVHYGLQDLDNKTEFTAVWDVVKTIHKDDRVAELKEMKKAAGTTINLDSARREYVKLLTMATNYAMLPDRHYNLAKGSFENLKRAMSLVNRVVKHYDGDMTKLKPLNEVYEGGMSGYRYNNSYEKVCKALADKLPALVVEKEVTTEDALLYLDRANVTVKTAMLERLLTDLGYSLNEVA